MHRALTRKQPLLERPSERCPMRVRGPEVRVPGVEMGVEVDERDGAAVPLRNPQEGQRDRVVAAQRQQPIRPLQGRGGAVLDLRDGLADVERIRREVAGVGDLVDVPRLDVEWRVIRAQELGAGADRGRAESRTGPIRHARVERDAQDRDPRSLHVVEPRQPRERVRSDVARTLTAIRRADGLHCADGIDPPSAESPGRPESTARQRPRSEAR